MAKMKMSGASTTRPSNMASKHDKNLSNLLLFFYKYTTLGKMELASLGGVTRWMPSQQ